MTRRNAIAHMAAIVCALAACNDNELTATGIEPTMNKVSAPAGPYSAAAYDTLLREHVNGKGLVNYKALKEDAASLDEYVAALGSLAQSEYGAWDKPRQLAFWINAYNAITLKYIVDNYPIKKGGLIAGLRFPGNSIRQIDGVWDTKTMSIIGVPRTLDAIEHEILRAQFNEPRIHVAIVCASIACPPLRNEAYAGERIEEQLADQSRRFVLEPRNLRIDRGANAVHISAIFDWFGDDFVPVYGQDALLSGHGKTMSAVLRFCAKHLTESDADYLLTSAYQVGYTDYDWALNEQ